MRVFNPHYFCLDEKYNYFKPQLIDYAMKNLCSEGKIKITIPDGDSEYRKAAVQKGFIATTDKSSVAMIDISNHSYKLPEGYRIMSFDAPHFVFYGCREE